MTKTIAFLGLGRMGRVLAGHILADGHELVVWNRTPAAADDLVAAGATRADDARAAVEEADVVVTALFGPAAVQDVVVDAELPFRPAAVWIDVTTVSPADAARYDQWARNVGVGYVHSPVIGSLAPARARALGVLVGGASSDVDIALPIVRLWADPSRLRVYDAPAKAATGKLVANLALATAAQGLVEALRLGAGGGLDSEEVLTVLDKTALGTIAGMKGRTILDGTFDDTQFSAALLAKDVRLMLETSDEALPAASIALEALQRAIDRGDGEKDFAVIAENESFRRQTRLE